MLSTFTLSPLCGSLTQLDKAAIRILFTYFFFFVDAETGGTIKCFSTRWQQISLKHKRLSDNLNVCWRLQSSKKDHSQKKKQVH